MNPFQQGRKNTDFLLMRMMIKRGSGVSKEDKIKISDMIDKEEKHLVDNYKLGLRGSFHKQILHNLHNDKRVVNYIEKIEETDCRASLYLQLGVLEALRDFFEIKKNNNFCIYCMGEGRTQPAYLDGDYEDCPHCSQNVHKANDPKDRGAKK